MIKSIIKAIKRLFVKRPKVNNERVRMACISIAKTKKDPLYDQMILSAKRRKDEKELNKGIQLIPLKILPSHSLAYVDSVCPYKVEPNDKLAYSDGVLENRIEINFNFER